MRVSTRLMLALCVLTGAFMGALLAQRHWEHKDVRSVLKDRRDAITRFSDKTIDLLGKTLEAQCRDYSTWTEMVDFVNTGNAPLAAEDLVSVLKTYDVDALWVYRPDATPVYFGTLLADKGFGDMLPVKGHAETLFAQSSFAHFFCSTPAGLMEVRGATIHPTEDVDRKTPPAGYLFAGRLWDREHLDRLSELLDGASTLAQDKNIGIVRQGTTLEGNTLVYRHPLDGWDGTPLAVLEIRSTSPLIDRLVSNSNRGLALAGVFSLSLLAIFSGLLMRWVTTPLRMVSTALADGNPARLGGLGKSRTEYGAIARSVAEHFEQSKSLGREIAERKQAEEALRESEYFSREVQKAALLAGWKANPDADYLEWTDGLYEIVEAPREYTPSLTEGLSFFASEDALAIRRRIADCLATGVPFTHECEFTTSDGQRRWAEIHGLAPVTEGKRNYVMGTFQDITDRRQAEELRRENQEWLELAQSAGHVGIFKRDMATNETKWSPELREMLGLARENPDDRYDIWAAHVHPDDLPRVQAKVAKCAESGPDEMQYEYRYLRADGELLIAVHARILRDGAGKALRIIGTNVDITERRRLEEQLRQMQTMDAVGQLAGGVAHDFNNLLQVILGNIGLVQRMQAPGAPTWDEVEEVRKAAERAAELTQQLLAFSRRQTIQPIYVNLNELIQGVLNMLRRLIGERVELCFIPGDALDTVCVDGGQIEQALMNLSVNARDAMPRGGKLTIRSENAVMDAGFCHENPWAVEGRYVLITVTDTGRGMDAAMRSRIFEPFFTTKEVGQGTGLGLATVYGIVKQHNGLIHVDSTLQKGTTFRVYLPAVDRPAQEEPKPAKQPVWGGTETILVAEDEPPVLNLLVSLLKTVGYNVLTACDGSEALRVFEEYPGIVDLALLDVVMPGLSGREAMERMKAANSRTRFLFSSGYSTTSIHKDFVVDEGLHLIRKPYRREDLLRAVRQILDAPEAEAAPKSPPTDEHKPETAT